MNSIIRSVLVITILAFLISYTTAQNTSINYEKEDFFKLVPVLNGSEANWVKLLYAEKPNAFDIEKAYLDYYSSHLFEKNIHTQNYKHWLQNIKEIINSDGSLTIPTKSKKNDLIQQFKKQRNQSLKAAGLWENIGPNKTYTNDGSLKIKPTQANVYCIAVAPTNPSLLYCGTESGGIFKSSNKGMSWELIAKDEVFTNAADIKIHPTDENHLLISTKKAIFQSLDAGETWNEIYSNNSKIEQFLFLKSNPNTILAATTKGLIRSTNQGLHWNEVIALPSWDIVSHPTNPNIMYVSVHNESRKRAEIYKSQDGGGTWIAKTNTWYSPEDINSATAIGCKIAVTEADPERIYACLIGSSKEGDKGWIGVYYSLDGGDHWVNSDGIDGGPYVSGKDPATNWFIAGYGSGYHQGWYNFDLAASDTDPDKIWIGTIWFCESGNRGKNIDYIRKSRSLAMHADMQDIDVVGNDIWIVSDGGINYSNNECQTVETRMNGITASNFWGFSQGWNEDVWTGGRYHNGNAVYHENFGRKNTLFLGGAEAPTGYINPLNNRLAYYSDISSKVIADSLNKISTNFPKLALYPNQSYGTLNSSEIEFHPNYASIMYLGRDSTFFQSTNSGQSFEALFSFNGGRVLEFEISRKDPLVIYCLVKKNGCKVYKSTDGGQSFVITTALPTSNGSTYDLSLDPNDQNNLWVILHNGGNGNKVFNTKDGGTSWINKTTNTLDNHKIFDVVYQGGSEDIVYVVTSNALFYWSQSNNDWVTYADGLPFVISPLKMIPFYRDNKLRLSSSRGIWEAPLVTPSLPLAQVITLSSTINCYKEAIQFEDYSILDHKDASWTWEFPGASNVSSTTVRNPLVNYNSPGSYNVSLTIQDQFGNTSSKTFENMIIVGSDFCSAEKDPLLALSCDGSNSYLESSQFSRNNVDHFTFTAWIKPQGIQNKFAGIFSLATESEDKSVLNFSDNNNSLGFHWNSDHWRWNSNLVVPTDEWSFVAMTVTPTEVTIYLNEEIAVKNIDASQVNINSIFIGTYYGWGERNFSGLIEEASFWDRALTQDEIRLSRHLTKQDLSDSHLIAYYQFNHEGSGTIFDKASDHDLAVNNANLVISTAPVGAGKSEKILVDQAGEYNFEISNSNIKIADQGLVPNGELVVSEIEVASANIIGDQAVNSKYWVINNYGENKEMDSLTELSFSSIDELDISTNPLAFSLFSRNQNSGDFSDWQMTSIAQSIGESNKSIVFQNLENHVFGQYFISLDPILNVENRPEDQVDLIVYPNPVLHGNTLHISSSNEKMNFTLLDVNGKEVFKQIVKENKTILIPNITNGVYYYRIISATKMYSGVVEIW